MERLLRGKPISASAKIFGKLVFSFMKMIIIMMIEGVKFIMILWKELIAWFERILRWMFGKSVKCQDNN